jgi:hypothetical protein
MARLTSCRNRLPRGPLSGVNWREVSLAYRSFLGDSAYFAGAAA